MRRRGLRGWPVVLPRVVVVPCAPRSLARLAGRHRLARRAVATLDLVQARRGGALRGMRQLEVGIRKGHGRSVVGQREEPHAAVRGAWGVGAGAWPLRFWDGKVGRRARRGRGGCPVVVLRQANVSTSMRLASTQIGGGGDGIRIETIGGRAAYAALAKAWAGGARATARRGVRGDAAAAFCELLALRLGGYFGFVRRRYHR